MRALIPLRISLAVGLATMLILVAPGARADESPQAPLAETTPGHRFGLVPSIGGGVAGVVHPGPLAGFIGFTDLGVALVGEVRPWGGFLRADFLSSGNGGRWTAWAFSAGPDYRLFGDLDHTALFLHGGLSYERWTGNNAGCPLYLVVPVSCNLEGAKTPSFDVTTDLLGVVAGARLELPIRSFYLAFAANFAPAVAVDSSNPSATFELRFDIEGGFRDSRKSDDPVRGRRNVNRTTTDTVQPFGK